MQKCRICGESVKGKQHPGAEVYHMVCLEKVFHDIRKAANANAKDDCVQSKESDAPS